MTRFLPLLSIPILFLSTPAAAACKDGRLVCDGHSDTANSVATPDPTASLDCDALHTTIHEEFDHVAGTARVDGLSVTGHWPYAAIVDDYVLTGLSPGTVVPITVVGDFDMQNVRKDNAVTWSGGEIFTPLIAGAPNPSYVETFFTASATGTETATRQLRLTMNFTVGVAYEIELDASVFCSGGAGGYSHGKLSFEGLPAGATITACKGYHQDAPTPTLAKSWGALKVSYR